MLLDPNCPGEGALLELSDTQDHQDVPYVLGDAVMSKFEGGSVQSITATVSGTFVIDKSKGGGYVLVADKVDDLRIERDSKQ